MPQWPQLNGAVSFYTNLFIQQVSKERGEQLAIEYQIKFVETSAKDSLNVEYAFYTLARDIKAKTEKKQVCYRFKIIFRINLHIW